MNVLAIVALTLYACYGVVFEDWKRRVAYPKKTAVIVALGSAAEIAFIALAVWALL